MNPNNNIGSLEQNKEVARKFYPESVKFCPCVFHADSNVVFCRIFRRFLF